MKKPEAFNSWCAKMGIAKRSHDESVAWAAWRECYNLLVSKFADMSSPSGHGGKKEAKS